MKKVLCCRRGEADLEVGRLLLRSGEHVGEDGGVLSHLGEEGDDLIQTALRAVQLAAHVVGLLLRALHAHSL